ncbi:MAG: LysR family transcriptional regulator [Kordiimonadaceae bacterium]|nr:LysR family transcriptional regulator [Kordiimonadaceae bacterium]MBO6567830.1 LysR family transcriptional regulator [Kordiimonadaceae bacterium]MBO6964440.1 LysR family transcriptional regulator [Kordiimonadaceae bacterium]
MNINAVRTVLLALETGSLSAAGLKLGVPPSTISRRIKELEAELGQRLIVRGGRGISAVEQAQDTLLKLKEVVRAVDDCYIDKASRNRLRVTATLEMSISILPEATTKFQEQFPETVVEIVGDDNLLGLVEADFDLAIRSGPLKESNLVARKLRSGGLLLAAAPDLANEIEDVRDLEKAAFAHMTGRSLGLSGQFKGQPFNVTPRAKVSANTFTALLPSVIAGLAYAEMPGHIANPLIECGRLVQLSQFKLDTVPLHALYPKHHKNEPALNVLIDLVEKVLCA